MQGRAFVLVTAVVAGLAAVPLAAAGAQGPAAPPAEGPTPVEVDCGEGMVVDPTHGEPGIEVTVTVTFTDFCGTDAYGGSECTGTVTGPDVELSFPLTYQSADGVEQAVGTFMAPFVEPYPPVVDATEELTVTVSCTQELTPVSPAEAGPPVQIVDYDWTPRAFVLDLFAQTDEEPPDADVAGVVNGSPSFTG
jgi:hypothetical protein